MIGELETAAETGLRFYGRMSASISHEIKNVLAIINENAGLLDDFCLMADRGVPIDPTRLKKLAATVMKQVSRGDEIIKRMNRLAHSMDETVATIELNAIIQLFTSLTDRFTAMRNVSLQTKLPENPVKIRTSPFFLLNLLWMCLEFALEASDNVSRIDLATEQTENGVKIKFKNLAGLTELSTQNFPSEREGILLDLLEADLMANPGCEEIVLQLSENIDQNLPK